MEDLALRIRQLVEPVCTENELFLCDIDIHGAGKNRLIKIVIDTEAGVTLEQCNMLSGKVSDLFFRKALLNGDYRLEVSSPGVNKPLTEPYEFRRSIGKNINVIYHQGNEKKNVIGKLVAFAENMIKVDAGGTEITVNLDDIENVRIQLKW